MHYVYPLMIVIGLGCIAWGLPAAHRLRPPFDVVAALAVLAGVCIALVGVLLTVVPGFFNS